MKVAIDADAGSAEVSLSAKAYSRQAVEVAAHVFSRRAEVLLGEGKGRLEVELRAKRKGSDEAGLRILAGDFVNELLNQEYRFLVTRFNKPISDLVLTQALLAARGGQTPPAKADEKDPAFQADVARMLAEARAEIARTMPKKLPPQGNPLPPEREDRGA